MKNEDNRFDRRSPIPKHLTPEERVEWEKEIEWEKKEHERRRKEGYYPNESEGNLFSRIVKRMRGR